MAQNSKQNATLCITLLGGAVDVLRCGPKVYVEVRLRDHSRRLDPVVVDPSTGCFSYAGCDGVQLNDYTLDEIYGHYLYIVLRSWCPTTDWTDAAVAAVPISSIDITEAFDFRTFILRPIREEFHTREEDRPSVNLCATLQSPFRPTVESVARLIAGYTNIVDLALDTVSEQAERVTPYLSKHAAMVPAIPMGVLLVCSLPLIVALGVAGFPLLVPLVAAAIAVGSLAALLGLAVWGGSRDGRRRIQELMKPFQERFGAEDAEVLYPIGPRPSLARVARSLVPTSMWHKLACSVLVDFIGSTSYAVPVLGESADLLWAPMSYILIDAMYHDSSPWAGMFGAVEEILPFTDIIPTATLAWLKEYTPVMLGFSNGGVAGGARQHQRQGGRGRSRVYHSNGDAIDEGTPYVAEPHRASS